MNLTKKAQEFILRNLSLEDALPTKMPIYVNSVAYLFGVITLSAMAMLFLTGMVLAFFGPTWYHFSSVGHFVNSLHFWSVQVFFFGLVSHLLIKFFKAAWRGGRGSTWRIGILAFALAVVEGLTGYLSQADFDSQWIAVQAKDALNALGIGAFFNLMDAGQMLTMHIYFFPMLILGAVAVHLLLVRSDSPVHPIDPHDKKKQKP